ncbi:MAG: hypothetical protein JXB05_09650 [Myxococcaceae bacterium]|nr:hypothetical protein [Myxococcaceae bacterium]
MATPRKQGPSIGNADQRPDFCIITALEEERDAVLSKFARYQKLDRDGSGAHTYFEAQVETKREDQAAYRIIVTCLSGMGPIKAALKASDVIKRWAPHHVLLVGIAGGIKGEVELGDVMVASSIVDYTMGKEHEQEPREIRWKEYHADANLFDAANNFADGWADFVKEARPEAGRSLRRTGIIASGGNVIASEQIINNYRATHPKLIGVEMEGSGIAAALHDSPISSRFLMIRGVSDLANAEKNKEIKQLWRKYACHVAAAYAIGLLHDGPVPGSASYAGHASSLPNEFPPPAQKPNHAQPSYNSHRSSIPTATQSTSAKKAPRPTRKSASLIIPSTALVLLLAALGIMGLSRLRHTLLPESPSGPPDNSSPKKSTLRRLTTNPPTALPSTPNPPQSLSSPDGLTRSPNTTSSVPHRTLQEQENNTLTIERLRDRHGVRPLTSSEDGQEANQLPRGVFGHVELDSVSLLGQASVHRELSMHSVEVHKTESELLKLVGYVWDIEAKAVASGKPVNIVLSPRPSGQSRTLVGIPFDRIQKAQVKIHRGEQLIELSLGRAISPQPP